jgi:hypothetical protein
MRPGDRRQPRWWHRRPARRGPPSDNVVLLLAVLCGILGVVWTLSVLVP